MPSAVCGSCKHDEVADEAHHPPIDLPCGLVIAAKHLTMLADTVTKWDMGALSMRCRLLSRNWLTSECFCKAFLKTWKTYGGTQIRRVYTETTTAWVTFPFLEDCTCQSFCTAPSFAYHIYSFVVHSTYELLQCFSSQPNSKAPLFYRDVVKPVYNEIDGHRTSLRYSHFSLFPVFIEKQYMSDFRSFIPYGKNLQCATAYDEWYSFSRSPLALRRVVKGADIPWALPQSACGARQLLWSPTL